MHNKLTNPERLWLLRIERNETLDVAAKRLKSSAASLSFMENGHRPMNPDYPLSEHTSLKTLTPYLQLRLLRKRSPLTLNAISKKLKVSRFWYLELEHAADPKLFEFWKKQTA